MALYSKSEYQSWLDLRDMYTKIRIQIFQFKIPQSAKLYSILILDLLN